MKIMNLKEHLNCRNYVFADGDDSAKIIYEKIFEEGSSVQDKIFESKIVVVMKGRGRFSATGITYVDLSEKDIFLLPIGGIFQLTVIERMHLVFFTVDSSIRFCDRYNLEKLFTDTSGYKDKAFMPLRVNERMDSFIMSTLSYIHDGVCCGFFMKMKINELFQILRIYYSKESLGRFLAPLTSKDGEFANFIYRNWESAKNLNDLAMKYGLSTSGFSKKFKTVFGVPAYQWIMDRKSERIYMELSEGCKSFKDLSVELNFYSVHHLGCYCKKKFGLSPGQIRKLHNKESGEEE